MDLNGLVKFAQDLGIEPTDVKMLIIAWKFNVRPYPGTCPAQGSMASLPSLSWHLPNCICNRSGCRHCGIRWMVHGVCRPRRCDMSVPSASGSSSRAWHS